MLRSLQAWAIPTMLATLNYVSEVHAANPSDDAAPSTWGSGETAPKVHGVDAIGPVAVGHPHAGYLFNAVQMPRGKGWTLSLPDKSWGTEETIAQLIHAIRTVRARFPDTPDVVIGSISKRNGGYFPPHKSHRTGCDVDIYLYHKPGTGKWYEKATADNLDRARTWALIRTFVTDTDIDFVLIDQSIKDLLEEHALSIGEPEEWIRDLFRGRGRYHPPLIKHIPGHTAHMHVRFVSPIARERGRRAYDGLVGHGHLTPKTRTTEHRVAPGDTLTAIASKHRTTVEAITTTNGLESTTIYVGQQLKIVRLIDIRGARDRVRPRARHLPPPIVRREDVANRRPTTSEPSAAEELGNSADPAAVSTTPAVDRRR